MFQLQDMVRLFGTLLLFDPIHLPKGEMRCLIGSEQKEKATPCIWIMSFKMIIVTYIPPDKFSIL